MLTISPVLNTLQAEKDQRETGIPQPHTCWGCGEQGFSRSHQKGICPTCLDAVQKMKENENSDK